MKGLVLNLEFNYALRLTDSSVLRYERSSFKCVFKHIFINRDKRFAFLRDKSFVFYILCVYKTREKNRFLYIVSVFHPEREDDMLFCQREFDLLVRIVKQAGNLVYRLSRNDESQLRFAVFGIDIRFALVDPYRKTEAVAGNGLYSVSFNLEIKSSKSGSAVVLVTYGKRRSVYH